VPSWSHVALGSDSRGGDLPTGTVQELAGGEMQNLIRKSVHERASPRLYRVFLSEKKVTFWFYLLVVWMQQSHRFVDLPLCS